MFTTVFTPLIFFFCISFLKYTQHVKKFAVEYTSIHARTVAFEQTGPDIKAAQNAPRERKHFATGGSCRCEGKTLD